MNDWTNIFTQAEQIYGIQPGLLSAIAAQENVDPKHNNPLGLSTDKGVKTFSAAEAPRQILDQARRLVDPNGPYSDYARTRNLDDLAKVWSPVGAVNDIYKTNATEAAGIRSRLPASTTPYSGVRLADDRTDLLRDIDNSIYGGGQAPPAPTPTPTGTPRQSNFAQMGTWQQYLNPQAPAPASTVGRSFATALGTIGSKIQQSGNQSSQQALQLLQSDRGQQLLQALAANPLGPLLQTYQMSQLG